MGRFYNAIWLNSYSHQTFLFFLVASPKSPHISLSIIHMVRGYSQNLVKVRVVQGCLGGDTSDGVANEHVVE